VRIAWGVAWDPPGSEAPQLLVHEEGAALLYFHPVREGAQIPPLLPLPASLPRPACGLQWNGGRGQSLSLSLSGRLRAPAHMASLGFTTPLQFPPLPRSLHPERAILPSNPPFSAKSSRTQGGGAPRSPRPGRSGTTLTTRSRFLWGAKML
jgi:hypothetical protein